MRDIVESILQEKAGEIFMTLLLSGFGQGVRDVNQYNLDNLIEQLAERLSRNY